MKHRFFKIGYILLALAITGIASVEIWHRIENTREKRVSRCYRNPELGEAESLVVAAFGGITVNIRGNYIKYPLGVIALSAFCFLGGYLVGDGSDEKKRQPNSVG